MNAQKLAMQITIFKTLETSLNEFVNKTDWTGKTYKQNEKINCSMYITISRIIQINLQLQFKFNLHDLFIILRIQHQF